MVAFFRIIKIALAIFCLPLSGALAADTAFIGQYSFSWAGIPLGRLALSIQEKDKAYELRLQVASGGIVNIFTSHDNETVARGGVDDAGYHPAFYESHYTTKKKARHVRLQYDGKGKNTEVFNDPAEDRARRPEVEEKLRDGSYDPLTALMVMRAGGTGFRGFDAKRLYEVTPEKGEAQQVKAAGRQQLAVPYILRRAPLGGLTEKEKKVYAKGEPPLSLFLSDDERRVPLMMSMPVMLGHVVGVLTKECREWQDCAVK